MTVELADRLQKLRKAHGYTQDSLADALGVSRQAVSKWECTEASPDTDNLIALARLYGITLDELVNGKVEQEEPEKEETAEAESDGGSGIHVSSDDGTEVHIGRDGIHVVDGKDLGQNHFKTGKIVGAVTGITVLLCVAAYVLLGVFGGWWHPAWIVFLAIPVVPSLVEAILKRDADQFAFPVLVTAIYLVFGCIFKIWHPSWVVFLTIPGYYTIVNLIKKH